MGQCQLWCTKMDNNWFKITSIIEIEVSSDDNLKRVVVEKKRKHIGLDEELKQLDDLKES